MNAATLAAAITEAERFLARARQLQRADQANEKHRAQLRKEHGEEAAFRSYGWTADLFQGSALTGAVRRSSLDLARALADLRRTG